ncbi:NAD-dependent epimerase/dehydratase family protein [Pontibacter cellulosilyticus]|uniref:NAD-dependent epimerase/dehydratase family protein n=1 Tax=Pontibacter cellulosilyticus TaxID=1720253 RepID=A0A923N7B1_9BACT|nr:NAD-dependent epimerase/dehydratase family protein [Pontibacter cellulosilyticus]MBC5992746.1 NAD-dependent epimerase/dehydratase family protein [Pontibacter cellulosilyticus]
MQTILGAGGAIGTELAKELPKYTDKVRLVSRKPEKVNPTDELFAADLLNTEQVNQAVAGSDVVYLVAGLEYNTKVWQAQWPQLMRNVLNACIAHKAKLVFFDNMYMYDPAHLQHMTEDTPVNPISKKGKVRAQIADMLFEEVKAGKLEALIARSADFIAPTQNSLLYSAVYENLKKGKKAMWFADASKVHTFTYTPDAAKATALLGNTPDAYNQVWHVPTSNARLTAKDWVNLFAKAMHTEPKLTVLPKWMVPILGLFMPIMREFKEMLYQYDRDYVFDSSRFEKRFGQTATAPEAAVQAVVTKG